MEGHKKNKTEGHKKQNGRAYKEIKHTSTVSIKIYRIYN